MADTKTASRFSRTQNAVEGSRARPFWIPEGQKFDDYPRELKQALLDIVQPLYEEEVMAARTPMEKSSALSFVLATWLEVLKAYENGCRINPQKGSAGSIETNEEAIRQYSRIAAAKVGYGKFHLQIKKWARGNRQADPLGGGYNDG